MSGLGIFFVGLVIFGLSAGLTRAVMFVNITDVPTDRSSHDQPTPKGGGIAIALAFLAGLFCLYAIQLEPALLFGISRIQLALFGGLAAIVVLAALIDDVWEVLPFSKLLAQFGAATFFALYIARIDTVYLPGLGYWDLGGWGYLLTILWIVFFMNAFNFMDGINGIAGGGTVISAIFLCFIAFGAGAYFVALSGLCMAFATLGFLIYNFPSGRVFMGDAGSQFIGFIFSALAVFGTSLSEGQVSIYIIPILFFPFIFDVLITLVYRAIRKQNIIRAHREHLYQIITKLGFSHVQVSSLYYVLFVLCGLVALKVQSSDPNTRLLMIASLLPVFCGFAFWVYRSGRKARAIDFTASGNRSNA